MKTHTVDSIKKNNAIYSNNPQFAELIDHFCDCEISKHCPYSIFIIIDNMKQWAKLVKASILQYDATQFITIIHNYWDRLSAALILNTSVLVTDTQKNDIWNCSGFTLVAKSLKKNESTKA